MPNLEYLRLLRLSLAALVLAAASAQWPQDVLACTSLDSHIAGFRSPQADDRSRLAILREIADPCPDYAGRSSDAKLFDLLVEAVVRGYDRGLLRKIFAGYRCLMGARGQTGYETLAGALDVACPSRRDMDAWYEVTVDAANLRTQPDVNAPRLTALLRGAVVDRVDATGEWIRVRTWQGHTGYVHRSLLGRYGLDG